MANHLVKGRNWIANELLTDSQMQSLIGERFYWGKADQATAGNVYIVYSNVSSVPIYNLGKRRDFSWSSFDIVVYVVGEAEADLLQQGEVADRIDEMFSAATAVSYNGWIFSSKVVAEIDRASIESDEKFGEQRAGHTAFR